MTWVEHSLVGTGIYYAAKVSGKELSLSMLLLASTLLMDLDHLTFRIASSTILRQDASLALGFYLNSGTWTHSLFYLVAVSFITALFFQQKKMIATSVFLGGLFHLAGDWAYRMWMFDMGLLWFWPFSWELF